MQSRFARLDIEHWLIIREGIAEWREAHAIVDLRIEYELVVCGVQARLPSDRDLAHRWGWTRYAAKKLKDDTKRWMDPYRRRERGVGA